MKRNLFILSGSGFIGLNFIKNFKNKNYKIYLIGKKSRYNFFKTRISKKIKIIYENILSSKKIKKNNFYNSIVLLTTLNSNSILFKRKFSKLLEHINKSKPHKVILISSVGVYGNSNGRFIKPLDQYSKNCLFAENYCKKKFDKLIILRAGNLFGIMRNKPGTIEKLIMDQLNIKKFEFYKYKTVRSYLPINEFINYLKKAITSKEMCGTYNIVNENLILSFEELKQIFVKIFKRKISVKFNQEKPKIKQSIIKNTQHSTFKKIKKSNKIEKEIKNLISFYKRYYKTKLIINI